MTSPWDAIGALARFAPTPHNTQPYRIRPCDDTTAELVLVCERLLPHEDRGNAYVLAAFGTFAAALEHAARACGFTAEVTPCDALDGDTLALGDGAIVVGTARIAAAPADGDAAVLLQTRRTSRLPYHDRAITADTLAWFQRIVEEAGHVWVHVGERARVRRVLRRNAGAIIDNLQDRAECEEIRRWHRLGRTPAHGDGLWQQPMNQPAWQLEAAFAAPWLFALPIVRDWAIARFVRTQGATHHVIAIGGPFATWPARIAAGRMLFELWLAMAMAGVYMQPFGSMLTNRDHAAWVADEFAIARPWLVLRAGFSDPPPAAPRLASIVLA